MNDQDFWDVAFLIHICRGEDEFDAKRRADVARHYRAVSQFEDAMETEADNDSLAD